jgi:hypothetical protein
LAAKILEVKWSYLVYTTMAHQIRICAAIRTIINGLKNSEKSKIKKAGTFNGKISYIAGFKYLRGILPGLDS